MSCISLPEITRLLQRFSACSLDVADACAGSTIINHKIPVVIFLPLNELRLYPPHSAGPVNLFALLQFTYTYFSFWISVQVINTLLNNVKIQVTIRPDRITQASAA